MDYGIALDSNKFNTYGYSPYGNNAFAVPNFGSSNAFQGYAQPYTDGFVSNTAVKTPPPKEESFFEKHWGKMLLGAGLVAGAILTKGKLWGKSKEITNFKTVEKFEQKDLQDIVSKVCKEKNISEGYANLICLQHPEAKEILARIKATAPNLELGENAFVLGMMDKNQKCFYQDVFNPKVLDDEISNTFKQGKIYSMPFSA